MSTFRSRPARLDLIVLIIAVVLTAAVILSAALIQPPPVVTRVAFLAPVTSAPQNIWAVDPALPGQPEQLTDSQYGVFDFAPDPSGRFIAYAENRPEGITELMLLDLTNGSTRQLTDCLAEDATCDTPVWRPDGRIIAYQRRELNTEMQLGVSAPRIWLMDVSISPPQTQPLFTDGQTLGSLPVWSGDGGKIALYESFGQGILVFDFNTTQDDQRVKFIPAANGATGALSPDGQRLAYTDLVFGGEGQSVRAVLYLSDLTRGVFSPLSENQDTDDGAAPAWHPDGQRIAITRQYMGGEYATRGQQVFMANVETGEVTPLIFDDGYNHGALYWNRAGTHLVVQRTPFGGGLPEIWTYALADGTLSRMTENAFLPRWLEGTP